MSVETSEPFSDVAGYWREYKRLRAAVLVAHGLDPKAKGCRVDPQWFTLFVQIPGSRDWIAYSNAGPDVVDRVRLGGSFKLRTRELPEGGR